LTIAGQTAGVKGIVLRGSNGHDLLRIQHAHHIVIRYVRFRGYVNSAGSTTNRRSIDIEDCDNILFDHLSMAFAGDRLLDCTRVSNFTLQNSILGQVTAKMNKTQVFLKKKT
jgi:uncharacterized Zn-binding protein involved in type VI secretion